MADIESSSWSETAASNNQTPPAGWPEGQAPSTVNDCAREMMAALKRLYDHDHATQTSSGTNTITLTYSVAPAAYATGQVFAFKAGGTNTGAATLNVNGLGAKNIFWGGAALIGFEIVANAFYAVSYDGTQFSLIWSSLWGAPTLSVNLPVNGDSEVWQRGAGGSASIAVGASTTAYTCDRGYLSTNANQASTVSQQAGLTNGSRYCARIQRNNGQTGTGTQAFGFSLTTDEVVKLRGQKITLSVVLRAGANWSPSSANLTWGFYTGTGTEGKRGAAFTGDATVVSTTTAITTTATRYAQTSSGTVSASATQGEFQFGWTPVGTAGANDYFELDEVQIDIGPAPLPFRRQLFADELARCQRHYQKSFGYGTAPAQNAGTQNSMQCQLPTGATGQFTTSWRFSPEMRTSPTLTTYNPSASNANWRDLSSSADRTVTVLQNDPRTITLSGASGVAGSDNRIHWQADADL